MFVCGPRFVVMSSEFKRWLKEPRESKLYSLAEQCSITIKREYIYGVEHANFYKLYRSDGSQIRRGKTERSRSVFDLYEAARILKKELKNYDNNH